MLGLIFWVLEAEFHHYIMEESPSLLDSLITGVSMPELMLRLWVLGSFLIFGLIVANVMDRQREAERRAREASAEHRQIFDSTADAMCVIRTDFTILRVNRAFERHFGVDGDDVTGRRCRELFGNRFCGTGGCPMKRITGGEPDVCFESDDDRHTGIRHIRVTAAPFRDDDGGLLGIIESFKDITVEKTANMELTRSEERFRSISATALDAIVTMDGDGRIHYMNESAERLFGFSLAEAPEHDGRTLIADNAFEALFETCSLNECAETGERSTALDVTCVRHDGALFPAELSFSPVEFADGWRTICFFRDVTARKKMEETLRMRLAIEERVAGFSKRFLSLRPGEMDDVIMDVLRITGDFACADRSYVFQYDDDLTVMDNTHEWCAEGIEPQQENLRNIPADLLPEWLERFRRSETVHIPSVADLPDGDPAKEVLTPQDIKSLICVPLTGGGKLVGFLGFDAVRSAWEWKPEDTRILDVTADIIANAIAGARADEKLRDKERQYRRLVENINDIVYTIRRDGVITYISPSVKHHIGLEADEIIGRPFGEFIDPRDHKAAFENFGRSMAGNPRPSEFRVRTRNGSVRWLHGGGSPVHDSSGAIIATSGVLSDITGRKRHEEELTRLVGELESKNVELEDFAYVVSHDLKAPLRAIATLSEWIESDHADRLDDDGREQLGLLRQRVRRMHGLIEGILAYSRAGRVREQYRPLDMDGMVAEVIDMLSPPEAIEVRVEGPLPEVYAEPTRVAQVFENLISNAMKFMDKPRGLITVRGAAGADGAPVFSVADNGPGIEEKHFDRIFKIFQTLSPADGYESTGVGLSLVKKIVTMYGGSVWVESTVGEGTTFHFTLPEKNITNDDKETETHEFHTADHAG